jgi:hypothetical protein
MNLQVTDMPLPVRLLYETPLTDDELLQFSAGNEVVWIERESDGPLYQADPGHEGECYLRVDHL